jgi:hypothetical protein
MKYIFLLTLIPYLVFFCSSTQSEQSTRWWKGNTHTHSWWSDGDSPPELIAKWYKEHDYHFLVFSDHNIMQTGEKWYPVDKPSRRYEQTQKAYKEYVKTFGKDWVEERKVDEDREVKLKTLEEFRHLFEEPDRFIFIKGEEITDKFGPKPVHMNGMNLVEYIAPQGGSSVVATIQNNLNAVIEQSKKYAQPMLAHLNHPNFYYSQTAEDFFHLEHDPGDGFFEMYNGHPRVYNHGDEYHQSTERIWDIVLSKRLGELNKSVIYGVATDDAHEYTKWGEDVTNPGRGWIMVKSDWLTPNKITAAIKRGDYYNSTGVTLRKLNLSHKKIEIEVTPENNTEYTIEFVGTLKSADLQGKARPDGLYSKLREGESLRFDHHNHLKATPYTYSEDIGKVLKTVKGTKATYKLTGNEIYVRARIVSNKPQSNPAAKGDFEMAWTQPVVGMTHKH